VPIRRSCATRLAAAILGDGGSTGQQATYLGTDNRGPQTLFLDKVEVELIRFRLQLEG
jgi:hypothetical protein